MLLNDNTPLAERMLANYENRYQFEIPRRTYTILRIDGRAFHTFTAKMEKPFDSELSSAMDRAAIALCSQATGCAFAYGQSDEYSFLLTDFASPQTEAWFGGGLQKIVSVAASVFTMAFNQSPVRIPPSATFDCRAFIIPDPIEVENYFLWRQQDAARNSVQMVGRSIYSHSQLENLSCDEIQEKLFRERGLNWNDTPTKWKRGRVVRREIYPVDVTVGDTVTMTQRSRWVVDNEIPMFTADRQYLINLIPQMEARRTT